ncbi:cytochrome b [Pistricoccus aurantiacus]|uniref:cytochrome b n=1 Tax=Pistricoccus aurantiacus TaxID=1883414 RepID=UPI003641C240
MSSWRDTRSGWGWISILIHWLSAVAIVGLFVLGWWMTDLTYYDSWYNLAPWWHRSLGMLLFGLILVRVLWRVPQSTPILSGPRWERVSAHAAHVILYLLMLVVLISGYLIPTAQGQGISVFGWFEIPAIVYGLKNQETLAGLVHWYSALALMLLAGLHTLAALKHHFVDHNDTLTRMLMPGKTRKS